MTTTMTCAKCGHAIESDDSIHVVELDDGDNQWWECRACAESATGLSLETLLLDDMMRAYRFESDYVTAVYEVVTGIDGSPVDMSGPLHRTDETITLRGWADPVARKWLDRDGVASYWIGEEEGR